MKQKEQTSIIFVLIISAIYILPLICADAYYIDDIYRTVHGIGWDHDGRIGSNFLMYLLTAGGTGIPDFAPYSQLFAALIVGLAGYIVASVLQLENDSKYKFSALIVLINPFYLENLTYRWDAIPMAVAVFSTVFPFLFHSKKIPFVVSSIIGLTVCMSTYQSAVAIYPIMVILLSIVWALDNKDFKEIFKFWALGALSAGAGLLSYRLLLKILSVSLAGKNETIFFKEGFFDRLQEKTASVWELVSLDFSVFSELLLYLAIAISLLFIVKHLFKSENSKINKLLICILPFGVIILIPFLLIFIDGAPIMPRMLIAYNFFLYLLLIFINKVSSKLTKAVAFSFVLIALPLMAAYANALKAQHDHITYISQRIARTVDAHEKDFAFVGKLRYSSETHVAMSKYPILTKLIPVYMKDEWGWGEKLFIKTNDYLVLPRFPEKEAYNQLINAKDSLPILDETIFYILRGDSTRIVVDFDTPDSRRFECPFY